MSRDDGVPKGAEWRAFGDFTFEYLVMPAGATKDDVQFGRRYWATVTGIKSAGLNVALGDAHSTAGPTTRRGGGLVKRKAFEMKGGNGDHVTGFVHKNGIPVHNRSVSDFAEGDTVGVMLYERSRGLKFEMVAAIDTLRNFQFEVAEPKNAATRDWTQVIEEEQEAVAETDEQTVAAVADISESVSAAESGDVSESVSDEGDGTDDAEDAASEPTTAETGKPVATADGDGDGDDGYDPEHFDRPESLADLAAAIDDAFDELVAVDERAKMLSDDAADKHTVTRIRSDLDELFGELEDVESSINSTRGWLASVDDRVDDLDGSVDDLFKRTNSIAKTVESAEESIAELQDALDAMGDTVDAVAANQVAVEGDGAGLPGQFGYAERMLHDLARDHEAASVSWEETDDGVRIVVDAKREGSA